MSLGSLHKKINELLASLPRASLKSFEITIEHLIKENEISFSQPTTLGVEIMYCFVRYYHWRDTPLFQILLAEYLHNEFQIQIESLKKFLKELIIESKLIENEILSERLNDEDSFALALILASLNSEISQLGFGEDLISHIKKASQGGGVSGYVNAVFSRVIKRLGKEIAEAPWTMDLYRLEYKFLRISPELGSILEKRKTGWFLSILYECGIRNNTTFLKIKKNLEGEHDDHDLKVALRALEERSLIFKSGKHYVLSESGYEITALLFWNKQKNSQIYVHEFLNWHFLWQIEAIRSQKINSFIFQLVMTQKVLHPQVLIVASQYLCETHPQDKLLSTFKEYFEKLNLAHLKVAAGYCLKNLSSESQGFEEVFKLVNKESSVIVRDQLVDFLSVHHRSDHTIADFIESIPRRVCERVL